ncbi:MAG: DUF6173 family protein [Pseudomonadota bacterium]
MADDDSKVDDPCAHAVHTDADARPTAEQRPLPDAVTKKPVEAKSAAEWAYQRLILYIQNFEEQLDEDHEVAIGVADGPGVMRILGMGYFDPDIVTFYGADPGGHRMQLIQHVSQLSVALKAIPKRVEAEKAERIGFRLAADLEDPVPQSES